MCTFVIPALGSRDWRLGLAPGQGKTMSQRRSAELQECGSQTPKLCTNIKGNAAGEMVSSQRHLMLLQKTRVQFLVPTWWLIAICNSRSRKSGLQGLLYA